MHRAVTVQNVAPLAYGDGQVVWGSRNLRFRLMVPASLAEIIKINSMTKAAISLLLKFRGDRSGDSGTTSVSSCLTMRNLLVRRLFSTIQPLIVVGC